MPMKTEVSAVGRNVTDLNVTVEKVDSFTKTLDEEVGDLNNEIDNLETRREIDNNQRKNNIKIRGLREGSESSDLVGFYHRIISRVGRREL